MVRDYIFLLVQIRQIKQKINSFCFEFLCITGAELTTFKLNSVLGMFFLSLIPLCVAEQQLESLSYYFF